MSSSSANEIPVEELTHGMHEQRIITNFDYSTTQSEPPIGSAILRVVGFGVITIVGIDPEHARIRDIAVEIAHSGFHTCAEVWVKVSNGPRGWVSTSHFQAQYYHTTYLA